MERYIETYNGNRNSPLVNVILLLCSFIIHLLNVNLLYMIFGFYSFIYLKTKSHVSLYMKKTESSFYTKMYLLWQGMNSYIFLILYNRLCLFVCPSVILSFRLYLMLNLFDLFLLLLGIIYDFFIISFILLSITCIKGNLDIMKFV